VAVHADVELTLLYALHGKPVDEGRIGIVVQAAQHGAPGLEGELATIGERACHAFDAAALARVERFGLGLELGPQRLAQAPHRHQHLLERLRELVRGFDQAGIERSHVAFLAKTLLAAGRPRADL